MEDDRNIGYSLPPRDQPDSQDSAKPTCAKAVSPLEVCEAAYREVTGKPLHLPDGKFDHEAIRTHVVAEDCPPCKRWYRNALRTYRGLQLAGKLPSPADEAGDNPVPLLVPAGEPLFPDSVERPVFDVSMSATSKGHVVGQVEPVGPPGTLGALTLTLECQWAGSTPASPAGWEFTLIHYSTRNNPAGNDPALLREFDNCLVTVKVCPKSGKPLVRETRLGLDEGGNLVSSPCSLAWIEPSQIAALALLSCQKASSLP